jgi:hypothetical protein
LDKNRHKNNVRTYDPDSRVGARASHLRSGMSYAKRGL